MSGKKLKVGIIGCGKISDNYFRTCKKYSSLEVTASADLDINRARAKAEEYGLVHAYTVDDLMADSSIDLVINLTIPLAHAPVGLAALRSGKHVYSEKPLAVTRAEGRQLLTVSAETGLRVGSAPDTFLGGGIQTCIKLIQDGWIGQPVGASAFMVGRGHEHWHPDPEFYYKTGGGPMFDMGPYYLTALVAMLGPIKRVTGSVKTSYAERTITSEPKFGQKIQVDVATHISGAIDFHNGVVGTIITSFDAFGGSDLPRIEIYGSEGTLKVPDPNTFGGPIFIRRKNAKDWMEIPLTHGFGEDARGLGVLDMVRGIQEERPHRASGELSYHVLEAMHGFHDASDQGKHYVMESTCSKPEPLPVGVSLETFR
ncbi:MAG: oxidoreductase protein [Paenibacillus sp.]|jgi:predicted dehydrogenase|nr:oxidoreductase protein [Paenibacillus sp.]